MSQEPIHVNFKIFAVIFLVFLLSLVGGAVYSFRSLGIINKKTAEAREAGRPADIATIGIIDSSCQDCADVGPFLSAVESRNVRITSKRVVEHSSDEGKALILQYALTRIPAVILTGEVNKSNELKIMLGQAGELKDDSFVLRQMGAPYFDLASGTVQGRTQMILLADRTCSECYDVTQHEVILKRGYGLNPSSRVVEIQSVEGRRLVVKYAIRYVPTFILTGDVNAFPALKEIWPKVGTIARDGAYVFRTMKELGDAVYRDLRTNKVIRPFANQTTSTPR